MSELAIYPVLDDEYHPSCNSSMVLTAFDYLEEYTAGIYNGTYLDSETSTGVKDPPAGHWKSHVEPKELE